MQTSSGVSTKTSMNSPVADQLARHAPLGAERRDERDQHDQPGIDEQLGRLADAADVLHPVGIGEAEIAVEAVADIVAVEQIGVPALREQRALDQIGDGRLARAGQAGEPQHRRLLALQLGARVLSTSSACQWTLVARRRPKSIMPAPTVALVKRSIRMKPPVSRLSAIGVERDRLRGREIGVADLVQLQRLARPDARAC